MQCLRRQRYGRWNRLLDFVPFLCVMCCPLIVTGESAVATHCCMQCGLLCAACDASHSRMIKIFHAHRVRSLTPEDGNGYTVRDLPRRVSGACLCICPAALHWREVRAFFPSGRAHWKKTR